MNTYSIDYETFWDSNKEDPCSVRYLGNWLYTKHPKFDAYLLGVVGLDGYEWCGNPKDFDWNILNHARVVAHNAGFELAITEHLRKGEIAPCVWAEMQDTADMAAYLHSPRSLEQSVLNLLGRKIDKGMRYKSKGKQWNEMTPDFQQHMREYCLNDCRDELELWVTHGDKWPDDERELSAMTRRMCWEGLPTDIYGTHDAINKLTIKLASVRQEIPWPDPALSKISVATECAKHGIEPPSSMAKDSPEFDAWLAHHGTKHPWAKAMGVYRSMNALLKKLITMRDRSDENGIFRYGMKYFGGHLGRDSGDAGFNVQNMSRKPMHGVFLRNLAIKAPPGTILGIVDEAQIEPRVLACISGDEEKMALMHKGMDVYEIQARLGHDYNEPYPLKEKYPDVRQHMKVEVLACGYGAGPAKVQFIAKKEVGLELSLDECKKIVQDFRDRKFIPNLWNRLENEMRRSKGENYELELPSGRCLLYRDVKSFGKLSAKIPRGSSLVCWPWWGGSLTENAVQAIARDIYMYHVLQIGKLYHVLLRGHDEIVTLLNEETAEQDLQVQLSILRIPPPWMPEFPAAAEGELSPIYKKI